MGSLESSFHGSTGSVGSIEDESSPSSSTTKRWASVSNDEQYDYPSVNYWSVAIRNQPCLAYQSTMMSNDESSALLSLSVETINWFDRKINTKTNITSPTTTNHHINNFKTTNHNTTPHYTTQPPITTQHNNTNNRVDYHVFIINDVRCRVGKCPQSIRRYCGGMLSWSCDNTLVLSSPVQSASILQLQSDRPSVSQYVTVTVRVITIASTSQSVSQSVSPILSVSVIKSNTVRYYITILHHHFAATLHTEAATTTLITRYYNRWHHNLRNWNTKYCPINTFLSYIPP